MESSSRNSPKANFEPLCLFRSSNWSSTSPVVLTAVDTGSALRMMTGVTGTGVGTGAGVIGAGGELHDQGDARWIVIRRELRGHNDTPFGWPTPGQPVGRPGVGCPKGVFGGFSCYSLVMLFFNIVPLIMEFTFDFHDFRFRRLHDFRLGSFFCKADIRVKQNTSNQNIDMRLMMIIDY
jgi:hypothetical protein